MSPTLADTRTKAPAAAPAISIILGPASCAGVLLLAAAYRGDAAAGSTMTALLTVLTLPYLTGWILKEHRLPGSWSPTKRSAVRHGSAALVGVFGLVMTSWTSAPELLMDASITLIAGSLILGAGRAFWNASAHVGMMTLLALWLTVNISPLFVFALVLAPLVGWSRTALGQHTKFETVCGVLAGLAMFGLYVVLRIL